MKKYGFFGGSFNPVTKAHVELALEIINKFKLDKVIFVPVGDRYNKIGLINEEHRYNMLKIATKEYKKLDVSNIELKRDKNLSTLEVFNEIEAKYKEVDKYYIMGADNIYKLIASKDFNILVENYNYIFIKREEINIEKLVKSNKTLKNNKNKFKIMENLNHISTSSSVARKMLLDETKNLENIIEEYVVEYIKKNNLYE